MKNLHFEIFIVDHHPILFVLVMYVQGVGLDMQIKGDCRRMVYAAKMT